MQPSAQFRNGNKTMNTHFIRTVSMLVAAPVLSVSSSGQSVDEMQPIGRIMVAFQAASFVTHAVMKRIHSAEPSMDAMTAPVSSTPPAARRSISVRLI